MDTQSQITKSSKTTKKSSKSTASSWVVQVNRGLALRAEGEAMIATALRERLGSDLLKADARRRP